jgi:hypothetical protein
MMTYLTSTDTLADARSIFTLYCVHCTRAPVVSQRPPPIIVHVINPTAFSGQGSIIMLELADEGAAVAVARTIAHETGRAVTVRNADKND